MFAALVGWYTGSERNRRRYPRVKREFDVDYTFDGQHWLYAQGVDLSGGGMCVISKTPIMHDEFDARIEIGNRTIELRVHKVWDTTTEFRGRQVPFYGLKFARVNPEDWESIIRSITGGRSSAPERFEPVPLDEAEAITLLPLEFRERLVGELRKRSRIDAQKPMPITYEYGGLVHENNQRMHQFTIRSSVKGYTGEKRFTTRLLVRDEDSELFLLS